MTGIRYRCEPRKPRIESAIGISPVRTGVWRQARQRFEPSPAALSVPRTLSPPEGIGAAHNAPSTPGRAANSDPASTGNGAEGALDGLRILIVEDDDDARELASIILVNAGAVVECAASAADGFDLAYNHHPQLLLSDIGMPDEDGYSLMRRIRALQSCEGGDILSIALSAFSRPEDRMLALRAGFTIHIAKPVAAPDLVAAAATVAALIVHRDGGLSR